MSALPLSYTFKIRPPYFEKLKLGGKWWLTSVILATWEAEIRRIMFEANLAKSS
jgi:hypothetical protein